MKFINITTADLMSMPSIEMRINIDKIISYCPSEGIKNSSVKIHYDHHDDKLKTLYIKEDIESFEERLCDIIVKTSTAYQVGQKEGYKKASDEITKRVSLKLQDNKDSYQIGYDSGFQDGMATQRQKMLKHFTEDELMQMGMESYNEQLNDKDSKVAGLVPYKAGFIAGFKKRGE